MIYIETGSTDVYYNFGSGILLHAWKSVCRTRCSFSGAPRPR